MAVLDGVFVLAVRADAEFLSSSAGAALLLVLCAGSAGEGAQGWRSEDMSQLDLQRTSSAHLDDRTVYEEVCLGVVNINKYLTER